MVTILNVECGDKLLVSHTKQFLDTLLESVEMAEPTKFSDWRSSTSHNSAIELHLNDVSF